MQMTINLALDAILAEMRRRHPRIVVAKIWLNTSNGPSYATVLDMTYCSDGQSDIVWNERYIEDYHGFPIEMLRLANIDSQSQKE